MQGGHHHHLCSCPLITSSLQDFHSACSMMSSGGRKNRGADRGTNSDAEDGKNCNSLQEKRHQGTIFQSFRLGGWILWTSVWLEFARRSLSVDKAGWAPGWSDVFQRCVERISESLLPLLRLSIWKRKSYLICESMVIVTWGPCDRLGTGVIQPTSF